LKCDCSKKLEAACGKLFRTASNKRMIKMLFYSQKLNKTGLLRRYFAKTFVGKIETTFLQIKILGNW
jgi:hypothetical protein